MPTSICSDQDQAGLCPADRLLSGCRRARILAMARPKTKSAALPQNDGVLGPASDGDDERFDRVFRPTTLDEFVGQKQHKENLRVYVEAARRRKEPLDHILLCGPPGLGKTTLAHILSKEMGTELVVTSGPAVEHKGVLTGMLTRLNRG